MWARTGFERRYVLLALLTLMVAVPAAAQTERSGGGGPNAQLYAEYQQAVAERTQLQTDNAKLKSDLADAQKQLAGLKQQLAAARSGSAGDQAALASAQAAQAAAAKNLATLRAQTDELIGRFRDTIGQLRDVETDRTRLRQQLEQSRGSYDRCAVANDGLYQIDNEVLDRYAHEGAFSHMSRAEPFTRLTRTRIDNLALEYHERAEQLRVQRQASKGGAAPMPATTSAAPPGGADHPPAGR